MRSTSCIPALLGAAVLLALPAGARADIPGVIVDSARTLADSVRDGVRTIERTTRAFVLGGTDAAQDAWDENAWLTREHARENADRVRAEAGLAYESDDRGDPYPPSYRDDEPSYRDDEPTYRYEEPLPPESAPPDDY
jgi:hypothetical protein